MNRGLTTHTDLPSREVALKYKQLWMVEAIFRSMKSLLDTRPIYHTCDAPIRGHVFCLFLALLLRKELEDRLARKEWKLEWGDVIRDLDKLRMPVGVEAGVPQQEFEVLYADQAPALVAGAMQINLRLPAGQYPTRLLLSLKVGDFESSGFAIYAAP